MKIGFSKDIHQLKKGAKKPLILGGVSIPNSKYYIYSHSDGDLILHSITSAILGVLGLKTIGEYFSDTNPINKNRPSIDFLNFALGKLYEQNKSLVSLDICIVCEQIMLCSHLESIRQNLINILGLNSIGIKVTRFEDKKNTYIECYSSLIIE